MSSGFVTEGEVAEARKRRQEEWEKVRTSDQPLERPEEPFDGRSLFDRLKEQKMKKDDEYEEAHKLKNLIRGLDDDEVQFLEQIDQRKMAAKHRQMQEDEKELQDFRKRVATLQEETVDQLIQAEVKAPSNKALKSGSTTSRPTQKALLGVGIKRKNGENGSENMNSKTTKTEDQVEVTTTNTSTATANGQTSVDVGQLKCIAILPGIGTYTESSDSELSSGSDEEPGQTGAYQYDLVGRRKKQLNQCLNSTHE